MDDKRKNTKPAKGDGKPHRRRPRFAPPDSPESVGWTHGRTMRLAEEDAPFELELGGSVGPLDVEYEAYGELSKERDNTVLIVHALSGDAHVAGWDADTEKTGRAWRKKRPGWWDAIVGPGKTIDTKKFYVVCINVIGSCYGTTGPSSIDPKTGKPFGLRFPMATVSDWVRMEAMLLDRLGIDKVHTVVGGSLGGQQVIEWALAYPERVERAVVLAASPRLSTQGLAFNAVGRHCIMNDPHFNGGDYYGKRPPSAGLSAARMLAHITYLSEASMHEKFGRRVREESCPSCGFGVEFEVENYLAYQGRAFVERFDANSYLYITRAMDYYDAAQKWGGGDMVEASKRVRARTMVVSFDSDWLYPPDATREFANALTLNGRPVTYVNVPSRYGHDAFLVETRTVGHLLRNFMNGKDINPRLWSPAVDEPSVLERNVRNEFRTFRFDKKSGTQTHERSFSRWQDRVIEDEIPEGSSVLDLGCGDGKLLSVLAKYKNIRGQGVELDAGEVFASVERGVPVFQDDLDAGLVGFPDMSFDYVVLEETLQTVRRPVKVLREMLRIGRYGIVSFPNFANYRVVYDLFSKGRMPVHDGQLPYQWYETPNIHLFTIRDFLDWASSAGVRILRGFVLVDGTVRQLREGDNMYAEEALLVVEHAAEQDVEYFI